MSSNQLVFKPHSEKHKLYLQDEDTDVILIGGGAGSGKTYQSILKSLKYIDDKAARIIFMRETMPKITGPGGLFNESYNVYPHFRGQPTKRPPKWTFRIGSSVDFSYIPDNPADVQGWQLTNAFIDEATEFSLDMILRIYGRIRSGRFQKKKNMTMTCNPDRHHFLFDWVKFSLDDNGIPLPGTEHKKRWMCNIGGKIYSSESSEELYEEYGKPMGMVLGEDFIPMSFRFIPMTINDNPMLLKVDPFYKAKLLQDTPTNQLRYIHGSWTAVPESSSMVSRKNFDIVEETGPLVAHCRAYDFAGTKPSESNPNPDWTVGVRMAKGYDGYFYIMDVVRYRENNAEVLNRVVETGKNDPEGQPIVLVQDPNSAGKAYLEYLIPYLAERGLHPCRSGQSSNSNKAQRFKPFASLAGERKIRLVRGDWNETFLAELESFDGINMKNKKDDQVDATATAFNFLCQNSALPSFIVPTNFNYEANKNIPKL